MIAIYAPKSESEAAVIVSLMEAYGIRYVMRGGAFSKMYPGPLSNSLNAQMLMVAEEHEAIAKELLKGFLEETS